MDALDVAAAGGIDGHAGAAGSAVQLMDRDAQRLPDQIVQGDVERSDRQPVFKRRQPTRPPGIADRPGILAHEQGSHGLFHRFPNAGERSRLTPADETAVGGDPDQQRPPPGVEDRRRPARPGQFVFEEKRIDRGNLHLCKGSWNHGWTRMDTNSNRMSCL